MRRILILATAILGIAFPVFAQQGPALPSEDSPQKGSAFPSPGSNRGPAFPKSVSPYTIQFNKLGKTSDSARPVLRHKPEGAVLVRQNA
jgi:hypothetical protein